MTSFEFTQWMVNIYVENKLEWLRQKNTFLTASKIMNDIKNMSNIGEYQL